MNKKTLGLIAVGTATVLALSGCGKLSELFDKASDTAKQAAASSGISISGVISAASSSSFDASEYMIGFQNRGTKQATFADLGSDGSYTVPVDITEETNGNNVMGMLVNKTTLAYAGPVVYQSSSTETESTTGFTVMENVENFNIEFDPTNFKGVAPSTVTNLTPDTQFKTRLASAGGKPVGADNVGKGSNSKTTTLNAVDTIDQDMDGIPDMFDAMNNGKDLDNALSTTFADSAVTGTLLDRAIMFMNLKVNAAAGPYTVTGAAIVVIEVVPKDASKISAVVADKVHSDYGSATMEMVPGGFTALESGHTQGATWSSVSNKLFKMTNQQGSTVWTVLFKPNNNTFGPGDLVRLKVTDTSGNNEYFWVGVNFKFQTLPTDTTTWSHGGSGTRNDPYLILDTGGRVFSWQAPTDEDGTALSSIEYSYELFYYDKSGNQLGTNEVLTIGTDTLSDNTLITEAQIDKKGASNTGLIQVDITARYPYGDNSANLIYFKRSSW